MCKGIKILCCCVMAVIMTGCGSSSQTKEVSKQPVVTETPSADLLQEESYDTSLMTEFYMSKGTFHESVAVNGSERNEKRVVIKNKKISLPQGCVRTMIFGDDARNDQFINISEDTVRKMINVLENAECQSDIKAGWGMHKDEFNVITNIVFLDSLGEYKVLRVRAVGEDYFCFEVVVDDKEIYSKTETITDKDTNEEEEVAYLYSEKLTQLLKDCMNWKEVTKEKFSEISAVSVYDVTGELTKELSDEEVTQVKLFLENVVETTEGETCGTSYYLSCTLQDEEIIFLGVSGDGCGFVATEGHLYSMANEEDAMKCVQLLKEK